MRLLLVDFRVCKLPPVTVFECLPLLVVRKRFSAVRAHRGFKIPREYAIKQSSQFRKCYFRVSSDLHSPSYELSYLNTGNLGL